MANEVNGGGTRNPGWRRSRRQFIQAVTLTGGMVMIGNSEALAQSGAGDASLDGLKAADPNLHKLTRDIAFHNKYVLTCIAAGIAGKGPSITPKAHEYFSGRQALAMANYRLAATALLGASKAVRDAHFGRFAALSPTEIMSLTWKAAVAKVGGPVVTKGAIPRTNLLKLMNVGVEDSNAIDPHVAAEQAEAKDRQDGLKFDKLEFVLNKVTCFKTTDDAYYSGADLIAVGAVAMGATGHMHKVPEFLVQSVHNSAPFPPGPGLTFYPKGERTYTGGYRFAGFNIDKSKPFPHTYTLQLALAALGEKSTGFGKFLGDLWDDMKPIVEDAIGDAAIEGIATAVGSAIPIPFLGTIIGAIAGAIITWLTSLCSHSNPDKVLGHANLTLALKDVTKSSYGKMTSTGHDMWIEFHRAGSRYRVDYAWRVVGPGVGVEPTAIFI